jgi:hypothetical protein
MPTLAPPRSQAVAPAVVLTGVVVPPPLPRRPRRGGSTGAAVSLPLRRLLPVVVLTGAAVPLPLHRLLPAAASTGGGVLPLHPLLQVAASIWEGEACSAATPAPV